MAWTRVAPEWDRLRDHVEAMKTGLTSALVDGLALQAGDSVLELGGGTGELGARLAREVGPDGSMVESDVAPGMVALLRARLAGSPWVEVAELDACELPFGPARFDAVAFRMGLMLIPEPDKALREIRRVLRPGGRLGVAVWGSPQDNPWMTCVGMAAMMHGLVQGGPPVGPGGPFSLADPDDLEQRVRGAGFTDVSVRIVDDAVRFPDAQTHLGVVGALAPPLAAALSSASDEARAKVLGTIGELTAQYRDGEGVRLPSRALLCLAA